MDLNTTWFLLLGVLLAGYVILDGFDFGVGILHLFAKNDEERRIHMNAIGPVWDGNEVWLVTGGGALFAAFPIVYATVFSGFYLAIMLLLVALIFRAVSLEFRGKVESASWKRLWDWSFGLGSLLAAVLFGVAFGNILRGIPLNAEGVFTGNFLGLLNPYAILVGVLTMALFTMHGAIYMCMKTDGALRARMERWASGVWIAVVVLYAATTFATIFVSSFLFKDILGNPLFWLFAVLLIGALVYIPIGVKSGKPGRAFTASSTLVASMFALAAVSLFPRLVPSSLGLDYSLTIYNASSTETTLYTMFIIALIGMPFVIGYTIFIYKVFKGKVILGPDSY